LAVRHRVLEPAARLREHFEVNSLRGRSHPPVAVVVVVGLVGLVRSSVGVS
jgi:hypothetical protein